MFNLHETSSSSDEENELLVDIFQNRRREKRIRERVNHMDYWDEDDFFIRFRLTKDSVRQLLDLILERLQTPTDQNAAVTAISQLLLTLRYFATGSMLVVVADFCGVHKVTASRIVKKVSEAIASLGNQFINFPHDPHEIDRICADFYQIARFPRVIGTIDCTHIRIQSPEALLRTRNVVERSYGVWKRRFPILSLGIKLNYTRVQAVIVACAVLHNIAILNGEDEPPLDPAVRDNVLQGIQEANIANGYNENGVLIFRLLTH
ncbi:hypothetical protein NQ315_005700 [Exocentrus adspersus]|uniref:Putative nuclease HARBI1 n=1 Tax=Exocentrus adspersus TaxID=1586481 RepID=A0AAV8VIA4_9CUCU|nr:hypothetical protein NQ315_005700 [Exocentrus adspersus]